MKCHYEILGVPQNVNNEDLKRAYHRLALKWHPDKNTDNILKAKEMFLQIQQAYETLSDPKKRAWYDDHRHIIISEDNFCNVLFDISPYIRNSCFKGFGDEKNNFYSVYQEVFRNIAAEDTKFNKENNTEVPPDFGVSTSSYKEVVAPFYAFWSAYCTKNSFRWLDVYDTRSADSRKMAKVMDKENKKIRDKAKKERNEEVRNLVAFVKKRDMRVKEWCEMLQRRTENNAKKTEDDRRRMLVERKKLMAENNLANFYSFMQELQNIEEDISNTFADYSASEEANCEKKQTFYCTSCKKLYKTLNAYQNHEKAKQHKRNSMQLGEHVEGESLQEDF